MARKPTVVHATQVQPGVPALVEAGSHLVGAVSLDGKIYVVWAVIDDHGSTAPVPQKERKERDG